MLPRIALLKSGQKSAARPLNTKNTTPARTAVTGAADQPTLPILRAPRLARKELLKPRGTAARCNTNSSGSIAGTSSKDRALRDTEDTARKSSKHAGGAAAGSSFTVVRKPTNMVKSTLKPSATTTLSLGSSQTTETAAPAKLPLSTSSSAAAATAAHPLPGDLPFPKQGVLMHVFTEFIDKCGGEDALHGMTTTQVCNKYLKPLTACSNAYNSSASSYCELLLSQHHPGVREKATIFVSHAWSFTFLDVVSALRYHLRSCAEAVIWFDLFSNNQHRAVGLPFTWWSTTFREAIQSFGHTVLVLAPWNNPIPLTRAWCLFEIYQTVATESKFEVAMSQRESEAFWTTIKEDYNSYLQMLGDVDVEKSEACNHEDKAKIFEVVRGGVGFHQLNSIVLGLLRRWVLGHAKDEVEWNREDLGGKAALAMLYFRQGQYDKAKETLVQCVEQQQAAVGPDHPSTLTALNNLAAVHSDLGEHDQAEKLYLECLEKRMAQLGPDHVDTLKSMNNLATCCDDQAQYHKAADLYVRCLEKRTALLGRDHPDTLATLNNLALNYDLQGQHSKAEVLFVECLQHRTAKLGHDHPDTLTCQSNLASCCDMQQQYVRAQALHVECLEKRQAKLGPNHPHTLISMENLAANFQDQREYDKAAELWLQCLDRQREILGSDHPKTLIAMCNLASNCIKQGQLRKAEELFVQSISYQRAKLGPDHPDTLRTMEHLAWVQAMMSEK